MKIVHISDTHGYHDSIETLPTGDILVHSGDISMRGGMVEIIQFNSWLGTVAHNYKYGVYVTPGNHDWLFQQNLSLAKSLMSNANVLLDEHTTIENKVFHFSPQTPVFFDWAFNVERGAALAAYWELIPNNTDVLVTHGPPHGILDREPSIVREHVGCEELAKVVGGRVRPKLHLFGHIHGEYGQVQVGETTYVNASICTERYQPTNLPVVLDV